MTDTERDFLTIMEESIRNKGTIDHTIAHGVFVGPGQSGKNTLMKRLMGEGPPDPNYMASPSTGIVEDIDVNKVEVKKLCAVASDKCNLTWRKLKYDEEALELMMTISKKEEISPLPEKASKQDTPNADKPHESKSATNDETDNLQEESKHITIYRSDLAPVDIFKKAVKLRRMDALREHLESSWSLYLTNAGGHMEHLPLLVCGPSIFFVTVPLHLNLDEPYEVQYVYPDGSVKKYLSPSTLIEEILQTLATIYTLDYVTLQVGEEEVTLKPTVFIIGTHRDCLTETDKIAEIDHKLQRYIKQTALYHQGSIQFASDFEESDEHRLIFTVNNLSKDDSDFQKIRFAVQQTVERRRQKEFTVQCPSSWLIFSLILHEKYKSSQVLRLEHCFQIAQECGISSQEELTTALSFIHSRLGLVRYFDVKELDSLVVVNPQILFDMIKIEEFHEKGIISVAVMKKISKNDSQLPFMWLIKALSHFRLAAFFKDHDGEKYFFPSALCHAPMTQTHQPTPSVLPPAVIAFESGFCPRGLAGALIKCLMTNEMQSKKSWYLLPSMIFRNQVSFGIEACGDVTLKILPTHLEIAMVPEEYSGDSDDGDSDDRSQTVTCKEAYTQINKCMKIVSDTYKKCEYFWTFYCTLDKCKAIQHPAVVEWRNNRPTALQCKTHNKSSHLPRGYNIWNFARKHNERGKTCSMHD